MKYNLNDICSEEEDLWQESKFNYKEVLKGDFQFI